MEVRRYFFEKKIRFACKIGIKVAFEVLETCFTSVKFTRINVESFWQLDDFFPRRFCFPLLLRVTSSRRASGLNFASFTLQKGGTESTRRGSYYA